MADIAYGLEMLTGKDGGLLEVVEAIVSDNRLIITLTDEDVLQRRHGPLNIFHNAQVAERARMGDVLRESAAAARAGPRSAPRSNSKRAAKRAEINALIAEILAMPTAEQLIERLDPTGIANARMNSQRKCESIRNRKRTTAGARWTRQPDHWRRCCRR